MRLQTLDGREIAVNVSETPLVDAQAQMVGDVILLRDVIEWQHLAQRTHKAFGALR